MVTKVSAAGGGDLTADDHARDRSALDWLLASDEAAIRSRTIRDLVGSDVPDVAREPGPGAKAAALLDGLGPDGAPGSGWAGPQWRLLALIDLGAETDDPRFQAAARWVVDQALKRPQHRGHPTVIDGLHRLCANVEGTALTVGSRAGMATRDDRLRRLADALIAWQWPDGGWNCHRNATGRRSSFHESLATANGLHEYFLATGDQRAADAAKRTAELFLQHRLIYSLGNGAPSRRQPHPPSTGQIINPRWQKLGYPSYWHYDVLAALVFLTNIGMVNDPRTRDGLDLLDERRRPDGRWAADRQWWTPPGTGSPGQHEVVNWGAAGKPNEMITFHALRIRRAATRSD